MTHDRKQGAPIAGQPSNHLQRRVPFGTIVHWRRLFVDDDAVAILNHPVHHVTKLRVILVAFLATFFGNKASASFVEQCICC